MKKAIFLDRDGVINKSIVINGKPCSPRKVSEIIIEKDVNKSLNLLRSASFELIVITNQPDIARGKLSWKKLTKINQFISLKTGLNTFYICPHDDYDNCECRKPKPGMLLKAAQDKDIDLRKSFLVGDRASDIKAGQSAGCGCFFLERFYLEDRPTGEYIYSKSLLDIAIRLTQNSINQS